MHNFWLILLSGSLLSGQFSLSPLQGPEDIHQAVPALPGRLQSVEILAHHSRVHQSWMEMSQGL